MGRRIDVEADDIADLGGELRVVGQLELAHPVRLQAMGAPDPLHRTDADPGQPGHRLSRPMGRLPRRVFEGQGDDAVGHFGGQRRDARRAGLVPQKAIDAFFHEPFLPAPDRRLTDPGRAHDLCRARAGGGQKHDPRAPDVLLRTVPIRHHRVQTGAAGGAYVYGDACSHPVDSHPPEPRGIPLRTQTSDFIH